MDSNLPRGTIYARGLSESIWPLVPARELFELRYGKALVQTKRRAGVVPVYGTNGRCGTHDKALFAGPGVIIGRKGQGPLGVEWCDRPYWVIDTAYSLVPLRSDVDLKFAYYLIRHIGLNHLKDGTSNPSLSRDAFGAQALPWPPLDEQWRIARILGALDDKIELNRRMSRTLESTVRAIFKSWFVDFDPVRKKMEGKGGGEGVLPPALAALFASSLDTSLTDQVPGAWRAVACAEEFDIVMGQSPPGSSYNDNGVGIPFYQGCRDFGSRYPARRMFCVEPSRFANRGDTLVSVRAPVGNLNQAVERCCIGRGVAAVRHRSGAQHYTYEAMRSLKDRFLDFESGGTVFGALSGKEFKSLHVLAPPAPAIAAFETTTGPLMSLHELKHQESSCLEDLRDALLPGLLSGAGTLA